MRKRMKKKYKKIGSGALAYKVSYKKSPKGRFYIGKATFQDKALAKQRTSILRSRGYKAWVEGRTVYTK